MAILVRFILIISLVWAAIHLLYRLLRFSARRSFTPHVLPISRTHRLAVKASPTTFVLKHLHLRIESSSWNASHDALSVVLARTRNPWSKRLKFLYNVGSILSTFGMLGSLVILSFVSWHLISSLWTVNLYNPLSKTSAEMPFKRSLDRSPNPTKSASLLLKPIIPGVTVPMSHLPLVLIAVLVAQFIHEMGHAISAALESIPLISVGASLFVLLPTTFVKLSSVALDSLLPAGRIRVIASGSFHNLLLWSLLTVLCKSGIGVLLWSIPYRNVSSLGRVVMNVEPHSSLYGHLPVGSLITSLGDIDFSTTNTKASITFPASAPPLTESKNKRGWCINQSQFSDIPESCCTYEPNTDLSSLLSCSATFEPQDCLDPVKVMKTGSRCSNAGDCLHQYSCVLLRDTQLLRIAFRSPHLSPGMTHAHDEVVIWRGLWSEFQEDVHMGILLPRVRSLPLSLPSIVQRLIEYLKLASVSLYFFNLLPLSYLDGGKLLEVLLIISSHPMTIDLEAGRPIPEMWKRTNRWIHIITVAMIGATVLLGCIHAFAA